MPKNGTTEVLAEQNTTQSTPNMKVRPCLGERPRHVSRAMISHLTDKTSLSRLLPPICPQLRSSKLADPKTCSKVEHSEAEDIRHKNAETSDTCNNQFLHSTDEPNEKASMEMNNFEKVGKETKTNDVIDGTADKKAGCQADEKAEDVTASDHSVSSQNKDAAPENPPDALIAQEDVDEAATMEKNHNRQKRSSTHPDSKAEEQSKLSKKAKEVQSDTKEPDELN
eukprot:scaffold84343_cov30-Tisochrysis_lutea.AAC.1